MAAKALALIEREIFLTAPWGRVALLTWGEAKNPPVLLCHGKQDSAASFSPLVQNLPKHFFYVGVDLPGNGKSDHFPPGVPVSMFDLITTIKEVILHFKWKRFSYIGHSLGVQIGKYYSIAYPGRIDKMVDLDPVPAYIAYNPTNLNCWYHKFYGDYYSDEYYKKYNSPAEKAPKYTYEQAIELMKNNRGLTEEASKIVLERCLVPAGEGFYRFTFDQRMKNIILPPFSSDYLKHLYTSIEIPILCVLAQNSVDFGFYHHVGFIQDESSYKKGNYKVMTVPGIHDVHVNNPQIMSQEISKFLNSKESKSKL